jgi:hypothetical protein
VPARISTCNDRTGICRLSNGLAAPHPHTLPDAMAERFCVRLCRYYVEHFGLTGE